MLDKKIQPLENSQASIKTILLVEDDTTIADILVQMVTQETSHQILAVPDAPEAMELVKSIKPQLLILDYWLPTLHGIELYDLLHNTEGLQQVPAILLSANAPLMEINQRQIMYIRKPFDIYKLLEAIYKLLA